VKYITLVNLLSAKDIFVDRGRGFRNGPERAAPVRKRRFPLPYGRSSKTSLDRSPADDRSSSGERDRVLFPEYLTSQDKSLEIAAHVIRWLVVEETREGLIAELAKLKARVGHGGASRIAADYIVNELAKRQPSAPRPHFLPGMTVASSGGAGA
jgi:hypothetical protein